MTTQAQVDALAAALHKAWPVRVKGRPVGNALSAATLLAALASAGWELTLIDHPKTARRKARTDDGTPR